MIIGLCDALMENALSIHEAEHYLFSPRTMKIFEKDPELMDLIHTATEFENLQSLVPTKLDSAIADVRRRALDALKTTPECDFQQDPWLYKLLPIVGE